MRGTVIRLGRCSDRVLRFRRVTVMGDMVGVLWLL